MKVESSKDWHSFEQLVIFKASVQVIRDTNVNLALIIFDRNLKSLVTAAGN